MIETRTHAQRDWIFFRRADHLGGSRFTAVSILVLLVATWCALVYRWGVPGVRGAVSPESEIHRLARPVSDAERRDGMVRAGGHIRGRFADRDSLCEVVHEHHSRSRSAERDSWDVD